MVSLHKRDSGCPISPRSRAAGTQWEVYSVFLHSPAARCLCCNESRQLVKRKVCLVLLLYCRLDGDLLLYFTGIRRHEPA